MSRATRLAAAERMVATSKMATMIDEHMPTGGRPRQLVPAAVLVGILLALQNGRPAQLVWAWRELLALDLPDRVRLTVAVVSADGVHDVSYRSFDDTFSVMLVAFDPSPVPSFRGVADDERAAYLEQVRSGVDAAGARALLDRAIDAIVEASIPDDYKSSPRSLAVDWTDHETWSRPRPVDDPVPTNDPDASWGHATRNTAGHDDGVFFGYYAQVAVMVADDGGEPVPELVRRICLRAPTTDPPVVMAATLAALASSGVELGDVLCDCGYSGRAPEHWAEPLRRIGAHLVMDLHPQDRGPKGTFEGAVLANGQLFCPCVPAPLLGLGPPAPQATGEQLADADARFAEADRYRLGPIGQPDADGYRRHMCPAAAGKVRCALKPASLALPFDLPSVLEPPAHPPRCCTQVTITVGPQVNAKTRQRHGYPGPEHRRSYRRRTSAERAYASLSDVSTGGIRRGWCRLFGLTKNTVMYALAVVARNLRIVESFERARAERERRQSMGLPPRRPRRRRRYGTPSTPPPDDKPATPG